MIPDVGRSEVIVVTIAHEVADAVRANFVCCFNVDSGIYPVRQNIIVCSLPGIVFGQGYEYVFPLLVKETVGDEPRNVKLTVDALVPGIVQKNVDLSVFISKLRPALV